MKIFGMPLIFFLTIVSCTNDRNLVEQGKEEVEKEVRNLLDNYFADILEDGLIAEFKYLDNSPEFFWVPPGYTSALTIDSVKSILLHHAAIYTSVQFYWDTLRLIPLSDNLVNYTGIVKGKMTDTAGFVSKVNLIESGIIIKRENEWKLLSGQSAALPGNSTETGTNSQK
jgi:hypothetical protein